MRAHGHLTQWNDERGFGFITPASGRDPVFVHVSAFPRGGHPPRIGEILSFEIGEGRDGRLAALRVQRAGGTTAARAPRRAGAAARPPVRRGRFASLVLVAALLAAGASGFQWLRDGGWLADGHVGAEPAAIATTPVRKRAAPTPRFRCDGRTHCSQMTSCAEARYFLTHCPSVEMDGDNDGRPCERQWCN